MLLEWFVVGGVFFWFLTCIWLIALLWAIAEDNGFRATIATLTILAVVLLFGDFNIFKYIWEHIWSIPLIAGGYIGIGAVWSLIKWSFVQGAIIERREETKTKWLTIDGLKQFVGIARNKINRIQNDIKDGNFSSGRMGEIERQRSEDLLSALREWINICEEAIATATGSKITPRAELKAPWEWYCQELSNMFPYLVKPELRRPDFLRWMCWWPISMIVSVLRDPFVRLAKWTYNKITVFAIMIRDWRWKNVDDDFTVPKK